MNDILTIAANLRTQDGRMTHLPIYCVQQKRRYPVPKGYSDTGEWYDVRAGKTITDPDEIARLHFEEDGGDLDEENYRWVWYQDRWEFVQPFFTEVGAQRYIDINGHNLREPRIYVESGYRNEEWETIRELLLALDAVRDKRSMAQVIEEVKTKEIL